MTVIATSLVTMAPSASASPCQDLRQPVHWGTVLRQSYAARLLRGRPIGRLPPGMVPVPLLATTRADSLLDHRRPGRAGPAGLPQAALTPAGRSRTRDKPALARQTGPVPPVGVRGAHPPDLGHRCDHSPAPGGLLSQLCGFGLACLAGNTTPPVRTGPSAIDTTAGKQHDNAPRPQSQHDHACSARRRHSGGEVPRRDVARAIRPDSSTSS